MIVNEKTSDRLRTGADFDIESLQRDADGNLEGAKVADTDQTRRVVHEFDLRRHRYTGKTWSLHVDSAELSVADAQLVGGRRTDPEIYRSIRRQ